MRTRDENHTFAPSDSSLSLNDLQESWSQAAQQRDEFIEKLDEDVAQRIVAISFGGPPIKFRIIESLVQICVHGTHHRAQLINMLRHSGVTAPALDYGVWVHETT